MGFMFSAKLAAAVLVTGLVLFAPAGLLAADAERGALLTDTCLGCHGIKDYNNVYPTYKVPKLGGQQGDYLMIALKGYRDGKRHHPTMSAQAGSFTDADIADIVAYLTSLGVAEAPDATVGEAPKAAETCKSCHGAAGISAAAVWPSLAGQHKDYIVQALHQYKSGKRTDASMQAFIMNLSDADIDAIATFFSQQQGLTTLHHP